MFAFSKGVWRDNLDETAATIRMAIWCRGWSMIDALIIGRKVYFVVDCRGASVSRRCWV
jgi:hypothetical protein